MTLRRAFSRALWLSIASNSTVVTSSSLTRSSRPRRATKPRERSEPRLSQTLRKRCSGKGQLSAHPSGGACPRLSLSRCACFRRCRRETTGVTTAGAAAASW